MVMGRTSNGATTSGSGEATPDDIKVKVFKRQQTPARPSHGMKSPPPGALAKPRGKSVDLLGGIGRGGTAKTGGKNVKWVDENGKSNIATVYKYEQQDPRIDWEPLGNGKRSCGCIEFLQWCFCHHKDDHVPMRAINKGSGYR